MRRAAPGQVVEVEVTSLAELDEALQRARLILLDNFAVDLLRQAVAQHRPAARGSKPAAASAWTTWPRSPRTGVDFVSLGALTHSAGVLDFSLEVLV